MEELEHIRKNQGMYAGDSEDSTRMLEEVLDNSLDEVQAGFANIIGISVDTKNKSFKILDNGRGIPFSEKLSLEEDPPVLICNSLFTSGKFNKNDKDSVYKVAVGLHGVGLTCVRALSDKMIIEIYRDKKHATYNFTHDGKINRNVEAISKKDKIPFSTKIEVFPSEKYFGKATVDIKRVEDRLKIACANFPKLKIIFDVDGSRKLINTTEDQLINEVFGNEICSEWIEIKTNKDPESCVVKFQWVDKGSPKVFSTVNLCKVTQGSHITKLYNILKTFFTEYASKNKIDSKTPYIFEPNDCLVGLRSYINLKIVSSSFSEQVKDRLSSRSDLSVMDELENEIVKYFKNNKDKLLELLLSFNEYRMSLQSKKLESKSNKSKRGFSKLTKLRDCSKEGGELIIGEGESAVGGLIQVRDPSFHAILPLRGVIPNVINKKDFYNNEEMKDIIIACGCGIGKDCDTSKLRYSKIILAADADPAGQWITALLITLFAYTMKPIIEDGKLYVCITPLYGTRRKGKFVPLWEKDKVDEALKNNESVTRFKGLGEFSPRDLKTFVLDNNTRKLIKVNWSEKNHEKIFNLMSSSEAKRELALGNWKIEE